MYQHKTYKIKGVVPTLFHSGRTANPLDPFAKEIKRFTSKRKKTDEDHKIVADLEWLAAFYHTEPGEFDVSKGKLEFTGFGRPVWPGENIERMLISAAKKNRLGETFKSAVMVDGDFPLTFPGPKTIEGLFGDARFRDTRGCSVGTSTVMRTRPIFREWELEFTVSYLPELIDVHAVDDAVGIAGLQIGLSDYRPKYGRFMAV